MNAARMTARMTGLALPLLAAGANINATDALGLTPLHCAALFGFTCRDRRRLVELLSRAKDTRDALGS